MSIDSSFKIKGALARHRNVLTRAERIEQLKEEEKWTEQDSVLGLPKVAHRKSHAGKKDSEQQEETQPVDEEQATETTQPETKES